MACLPLGRLNVLRDWFVTDRPAQHWMPSIPSKYHVYLRRGCVAKKSAVVSGRQAVDYGRINGGARAPSRCAFGDHGLNAGISVRTATLRF